MPAIVAELREAYDHSNQEEMGTPGGVDASVHLEGSPLVAHDGVGENSTASLRSDQPSRNTFLLEHVPFSSFMPANSRHHFQEGGFYEHCFP